MSNAVPPEDALTVIHPIEDFNEVKTVVAELKQQTERWFTQAAADRATIHAEISEIHAGWINVHAVVDKQNEAIRALTKDVGGAQQILDNVLSAIEDLSTSVDILTGEAELKGQRLRQRRRRLEKKEDEEGHQK